MVSLDKNYFVMRSMDYAPDGRLGIGSILADPEDPSSVLGTWAQSPRDATSKIEQRDFSASRVTSDDLPSARLITKFLATTGLAANVGGKSAAGVAMNSDYSLKCDKLETFQFAPSHNYIVGCAHSLDVQRYLQESHGFLGRRQRPIYVVTGLMIAKGARMSTLNVSVSGAAVSVGPLGCKTLTGSNAGRSMFFGGEGDFIFAYKLTKVNVKERFPSIARPIESEGQEDGKKPTTDADASEEEAPSETRPGLGVESTDGEDLVFDGEEDIAVSDPTKPARILCLDGGGVRGISSLCMLKEIMLEVGREKQRRSGAAGNPEPVRPCDYFDLICGTSTGGLIALMLGRLRYTVDEAIDQYTRLSEAIFTSRSNNPEAKYDHKVLEEKIKEIVKNSSLGLKPDARLEDLEPGACKTFVIAMYYADGSTPYLMRSYKTPEQSIEPAPFPARIWEAARATSAAPTYFEPIEIDLGPRNGESKLATFGDGGTTANNPSYEALVEFKNIWPARHLGCIVSLGTGVEKAARILHITSLGVRILRFFSQSAAHQADVGKYCSEVATSCNKTHHDVGRAMKRLKCPDLYFRLNVPDIGQITLDQFAEATNMRNRTAEYMAADHAKKKVRSLGVILFDPESIYQRMLEDEFGHALGDVLAPEFQAIPLTSSLLEEFYKIRAKQTSPNVNDGSQNQDVTTRSAQATTSSDGKLAIQWTWPHYSNKLSVIQSVIFHHHDKHGATSDNGAQRRQSESQLSGRGNLKSAVAFLELDSKFSFVSSKFVKKWHMEPQLVPAGFPTSLKIGHAEVVAETYITLAFSCHGFEMPKQQTYFWILESDEFEILFGENALKRSKLDRLVEDACSDESDREG